MIACSSRAVSRDQQPPNAPGHKRRSSAIEGFEGAVRNCYFPARPGSPASKLMVSSPSAKTAPLQAQSSDEPLRVVHVITGLTVGGAETMLWRLLTALGPSVENAVICLSSGGPLVA